MLDILNDPRSWFGSNSGAFPYVAVEATSATEADWIVEFATAGELKALGFGGLSVTLTQKDLNGRYVTVPVTRFNWTNWNIVPRASGFKSIRSYRAYVVNHELGHVLGEGHRRCIAGGPAPIMLQQTKGTGSCTPNPWPQTPEIMHAAQKGHY